jgi:hypothetical protein
MDIKDFIREFTKTRSINHYTHFWSRTASSEGLTVKTPDGKEIMVKPEEIYCEDLGSICGSCMCGHGIRYQYFLGKVGPIGSTCIQTITGLDGQDLRYILQGGIAARKDVADLMQCIETYGTFKGQLEQDKLFAERYNFVDLLQKIPTDAIPFVRENVPMPAVIRNLIYRVYNLNQIHDKIKSKYGDTIATLLKVHRDVAQDIEDAISELKIPLTEKMIHLTIRDIGSKLEKGNTLSPKALEFWTKLVQRGSDKRFIDALTVLSQLNIRVDVPEFWANIVKENIDKALLYGLSEAQINFILTKSSIGKDGLAIRFKDLLTKSALINEKVEEKNYTIEPMKVEPPKNPLILKAQSDGDEPSDIKELDFEVDMPD